MAPRKPDPRAAAALAIIETMRPLADAWRDTIVEFFRRIDTAFSTAKAELRAGDGDQVVGRERLAERRAEARYRRRIELERSLGLAHVHTIAQRARRELGLKETR